MNARAAPARQLPRDVSQYSGAERRVDAIVHLLGLAAALAACVVFPMALPRPVGAMLVAALVAYAAGLLGMLACSTLYNRAPPGRRRQVLRRLDHAAIFIMIAGTYTPISLLAVGGAWGGALLALVWTGALCGSALKLFAPARFERMAVVAYLALGWAGAVAVHRLVATLPGWSLALLLAGGLIYSLGVVLHLSTRLRFHAALWHGCVVAAAGCHYAVILGLAMSPPA
ncbi:MAG: hemolysin III family protein [Acetobacteraceae bacterium]|nr:hemolysin III family protein [Acetobacteraceae bacterium]